MPGRSEPDAVASCRANGIRIELEEHGPVDAPAWLLIRGLGTQLVQWPRSLVDALVAAGFRVVLFDNRDAGLSEKLDAAGVPDAAALLRGELGEPPYRLQDMADDTVGVMDALGLEVAHVMGISMGGMIAQRLAIHHPGRCRSLVSVMSSSGAAGLPGPTPEAAAALRARPEDPDDREQVLELAMRCQRVIGSPGYPMTDAELRRYVEVAYDRCHCPEGLLRQLAAVTHDRDRAERLGEVRTPTLVIHGAADPLVPLAAGRDTARRIPEARFEAVAGMGHDVTEANAPLLARHLIGFARG